MFHEEGKSKIIQSTMEEKRIFHLLIEDLNYKPFTITMREVGLSLKKHKRAN